MPQSAHDPPLLRALAANLGVSLLATAVDSNAAAQAHVHAPRAEESLASTRDKKDGQPVFFGCVICQGRKLRSRKSNGSLICKHHSCMDGLKQLNDAVGQIRRGRRGRVTTLRHIPANLRVATFRQIRANLSQPFAQAATGPRIPPLPHLSVADPNLISLFAFFFFFCYKEEGIWRWSTWLFIASIIYGCLRVRDGAAAELGGHALGPHAVPTRP